MFATIEEALQTKKVTIVAERDYCYCGLNRTMIKARRANGKKVYMIIKYENGTYSSAT